MLSLEHPHRGSISNTDHNIHEKYNLLQCPPFPEVSCVSHRCSHPSLSSCVYKQVWFSLYCLSVFVPLGVRLFPLIKNLRVDLRTAAILLLLGYLVYLPSHNPESNRMSYFENNSCLSKIKNKNNENNKTSLTLRLKTLHSCWDLYCGFILHQLIIFS